MERGSPFSRLQGCPGRRRRLLPLLRPNPDQPGQRKAKGKEYVGRIFTREQDRDQIPALAVRDAQAEAIADWGLPDMSKLARLAGITQRTLVANGDNDIVVATVKALKRQMYGRASLDLLRKRILLSY